jgi:GntR family transcriptional regulator/MocR family aminotransferase
MPKPPGQCGLPELAIDRASEQPLSRQIHAGIAKAILEGRLEPRAPLPSSRQLSVDLGVARNTVNSAYDQLVAEGYVECFVGSGTRVASALPAEIALAKHHTQRRRAMARHLPHLSRRGSRLTDETEAADRVERRGPAIGHPALEHFPFKIWSRLMAQQIRSLRSKQFGYTGSLGYGPLRRLIAEHVVRTRGISVESDHVIIMAGAQQALDVAARVLLDAGDRVLFEDPGYIGARMAFLAAEVTICPVPVDAEGMNIERARDPRARAAYVTPAHQFPLGMKMSLARRLAMLEWAEASNAWIFEDDYDGDHRYAGKPLSALASLDSSGRVVYIGTFSKVLFPGLRLGFMVVPPRIAQRVGSARGFVDRQCPILEQATLAAFIEQGYFARHIRRMRSVYAERRGALIRALQKHGGDALEVDAPETGMHVIAWLPEGASDVRIADAVGGGALTVLPLSGYCVRQLPRPGLVVGFSQSATSEIEPSARNVATVIRRMLQPTAFSITRR